MIRLQHTLALLLVFGSMWLHGVLLMPLNEHNMTHPTPSCLVSCLSGLHVNDADDGVVVSVAGVLESPIYEDSVQPFVSSTYATRIESFYDPGQILTTQKRE